MLVYPYSPVLLVQAISSPCSLHPIYITATRVSLLYTLSTTPYLTVSILVSVGIAHLVYYTVLLIACASPCSDPRMLAVVIHSVLCEQLIPSMYHLHYNLPVVTRYQSEAAMPIGVFDRREPCCHAITIRY